MAVHTLALGAAALLLVVGLCLSSFYLGTLRIVHVASPIANTIPTGALRAKAAYNDQTVHMESTIAPDRPRARGALHLGGTADVRARGAASMTKTHVHVHAHVNYMHDLNLSPSANATLAMLRVHKTPGQLQEGYMRWFGNVRENPMGLDEKATLNWKRYHGLSPAWMNASVSAALQDYRGLAFSYGKGGLGNQLFSVAATLSLAIASNRLPVIECNSCYRHEALRQFHCYPARQGRPTLPTGVKTHIIRWGEAQPDASHAHVVDYMSTKADVVWLKGFTQSFYSFQQHWPAVCWALRPRIEIQQKAQKYIDDILLASGVNITNRTHVVMVHIRRGDYVSRGDYHGTLTKEYYTNALQMIRAQVAKADPDAAKEGLVVITFGEQTEIDWCRKNMVWARKDGIQASICADAKGKRCSGELVDMYALALGHWLIIANSSFSWWSHFFRLCRKRLRGWHLASSTVLARTKLEASVFPHR